MLVMPAELRAYPAHRAEVVKFEALTVFIGAADSKLTVNAIRKTSLTFILGKLLSSL